jgi:hypothetical protein
MAASNVAGTLYLPGSLSLIDLSLSSRFTKPGASSTSSSDLPHFLIPGFEFVRESQCVVPPDCPSIAGAHVVGNHAFGDGVIDRRHVPIAKHLLGLSGISSAPSISGNASPERKGARRPPSFRTGNQASALHAETEGPHAEADQISLALSPAVTSYSAPVTRLAASDATSASRSG